MTCGIRGRFWAIPLLAAVGVAAAGRDVRLIEAVKTGDPAAVRALLDQGIEVNGRANDGATALHWAVYGGGREIAELLIRRGADVQAANRYGVTPLSLACAGGDADLVALLLKAGADPNAPIGDGETPLLTAARTGSAAAVRLLLASGAEVDARERWKGQTALMWAAAEGHADVVEALIAAGADVHARSHGDAAAARPSQPQATAVAAAGAPASTAAPADTSPARTAGFSALLFAVRAGWLDVARLLIDAGANVNESAPDGTSALVVGIINGHFDIAAWLLERGADPNAPDPRGSALHALTWMRNPGYPAAPPRTPKGSLDGLQLADALLAHGANPDIRVAWQEIPFDVDLGVVKGPPNIAIGRNYLSFVGATPFYLAARGGDVELMRLLASHGADPRIPTAQQVTPLMAAAGLGFWDGESPGPESGVPESRALEAVALAWELGNDVNAVSDYGNLGLEGDGESLRWRHPLNLQQYAKAEAALGDMRWGGSTALHGAAVRGANSIVSFLVEKGARLDAKNALGWTPLTVAEGIFVANTQKEWPATAALLRELMRTATTTPSDRLLR